MPKKFDPALKDRAVRMLVEAIPEHENKTAAVAHVAGLLGLSPETLRTWVRRVEIDAGRVPGVTSEMLEESRRLRRENAELRKANEVLKAASVFFCEGARPTLHEMIRFIDMHRDRFGVELICRVLRPAVRGFVSSG